MRAKARTTGFIVGPHFRAIEGLPIVCLLTSPEGDMCEELNPLLLVNRIADYYEMGIRERV